MVVGNVIGTGVFLKARVMTCNVDTPGMVIGVWVIAGVMSLLGALTYAELATIFPRAGGEYVFIRQAYGRLWGFLYGWTRFFVATAGALAALATGFAMFVTALAGGGGWHATFFLPFGWDVSLVQVVAVVAIWAVTLVNCANVSTGGRVASVLTALKLLLVSSVGIGAFVLADGSWSHYGLSGAAGTCEGVDAAARGGIAGIGAAMMAALWGYNGWNEVTYVAGEVKNPGRALPIAIIGGILTVAALYVTVNAGYFYVLPPVAIASVPAASPVATVVATQFLGPAATGLMSGLLAVSVMTALQIVALVGARIPYAMANDGVFFRSLAQLSPRTRVPVRALMAQATWASVLVVSGFVRHADRLRDLRGPDFHGARDGVGVRLPSPPARRRSALSNVGLPGGAGALPADGRVADRQHAADQSAPGLRRPWPCRDRGTVLSGTGRGTMPGMPRCRMPTIECLMPDAECRVEPCW